jgi:membrane associated rhomboid family serine protease
LSEIRSDWPRGTIALSAAILLVFALEHAAGLEDRPIVAALRLGAIDRGAVFQAGELFRLLAAAFVHFPLGVPSGSELDILLVLPHVLLNGWALIQLGSFFESVFGTAKLVAVFLLSALGCSLASAFFAAGVSGGASGGIFGLLGFLVAARALHPPEVRTLVRDTFGGQLVFWAAVAIVVGATRVLPIDQAGHLGGLATGLALGAVLRGAGEPRRAVRAIAKTLVLVTLLAFTAVGLDGEKTAKIEASLEDAALASQEPDATAAAKGLDEALLEARGGDPGAHLESVIPRIVGRSPARALALVEAAVAAVRSSDALAFAEQSAPLVGPPWSEVLLATGRLGAGETERARDELARARAQLAPAERAALAIFYERQGWSGPALELLRSAVDERPKDPELLNSLAWVLLTAKDARFREPGRGLELARRSVELGPDRPESLDTLAEGELQAGLAADALAHEERAVELAREARNVKLVHELEPRLEKIRAVRR